MTCRVVFAMLTLSFTVCSSDLVAGQNQAASLPVPELLEQLDADNFQARETAAAQLAERGEQVLKAIALHTLSASPESSWRIRSIIEEIGTAGSEGTFYKSTGVLRLLYPLDDAGTKERLEHLRQQWKLARKKNAIKRLRELGATISDPYGDQLAVNAPGGWQLANGGRIIINGRVLNQQQVATASTATENVSSKSKPQKLTRKELTNRIDDLLQADLATNRERIFGTQDAEAESRTQSASGMAAGAGNPFARNVLRANQVRVGAMALFDKAFRGSAEDLRALRDIPNLTLIHWKDRQLDAAEMASAHNSGTILRVHFENCVFPEKPLPESAWPRLATHYEFVNQTVPVSAIERLQDSTVNSLKFSSCEATSALHATLRQINSLSQLALEEMQVDKDWFDTMAQIKSLTRVSLKICKFNADEYRNLNRLRPNLLVDFTPQAFLGVRGSDAGNANLQRARMLARIRAAKKLDPKQKIEEPKLAVAPEETGCAISEVIRGSGADKAGLKAGDVIKKLDGESIEVFEDIRLVIAQHRVGEELAVQFKRNGKLETATIELGGYPKADTE